MYYGADANSVPTYYGSTVPRALYVNI